MTVCPERAYRSFFLVRGLKIEVLVQLPPGKKEFAVFLISNSRGFYGHFFRQKIGEKWAEMHKNLFFIGAHDHSYQSTSLKFLI